MIDFSNCIELPENIKYGKFKRFRINITGFYYWGDGFRTQEDYNQWKDLLLELQDNLDDIITNSAIIGRCLYVKAKEDSSCDTIISSNKKYDPLYVYLHPSEITGILTENDINNLYSFVIQFCKRINKQVEVKIVSMEDTYHLNDVEYVNILIQNTQNIIDTVQKYVNTLNDVQQNRFFDGMYREVGFDFAETARISTDFLPSVGYGSSDVDIMTINSIIKNAIKTKNLKKR